MNHTIVYCIDPTICHTHTHARTHARTRTYIVLFMCLSKCFCFNKDKITTYAARTTCLERNSHHYFLQIFSLYCHFINSDPVSHNNVTRATRLCTHLPIRTYLHNTDLLNIVCLIQSINTDMYDLQRYS